MVTSPPACTVMQILGHALLRHRCASEPHGSEAHLCLRSACPRICMTVHAGGEVTMWLRSAALLNGRDVHAAKTSYSSFTHPNLLTTALYTVQHKHWVILSDSYQTFPKWYFSNSVFYKYSIHLVPMFENTYFTYFFQISKKRDFLRFFEMTSQNIIIITINR